MTIGDFHSFFTDRENLARLLTLSLVISGAILDQHCSRVCFSGPL